MRFSHRSGWPHVPVAGMVLAYLVFAASLLSAETARLMTFNISRVSHYATAGSVRIIQGLQPDVAFLQEWIIDDTDPHWSNYDEWVTTAFGYGFHHYRGLGSEGPFSMKNGIVSRWPIRSSGSWKDPRVEQRFFDWAVIDIPGSTDLQVVSVHFHSDDVEIRQEEAHALISQIESHFSNTHYLVVGGDFNTSSRNAEPIPTLLAPSTWSQGHPWLTTDDGIPTDATGNDATNLKRDNPYDWLIPSIPLARRIRPLILGSEQRVFPSGIVFDSHLFPNVTTALPPILYHDSYYPAQEWNHLLCDMDHCPVMKAYDIIPAPAPVEPWPLQLHCSDTLFYTGSSLTITMDMGPVLDPFENVYLRLTGPDGSRHFIQRRRETHSTHLSPGVRPFRGPFTGPSLKVLDFRIYHYPVVTGFRLPEETPAGWYTLEAAVVRRGGEFIGPVEKEYFRVLRAS